ncbi:MAG: hypothetical protein WBE11_10400 [Candidatus Aminicenantaceae bacterium]
MKFNKKGIRRRPASILFIRTIMVLFLIFAPSILQTVAQEHISGKEMARLQKKWFGIKSWEADYREVYKSAKPAVIIFPDWDLSHP